MTDRKVDTQDFNLFAANFGGSSKVFSQGNFDYDVSGNVNSIDFNIFVDQYGKSLPSPAPLSISSSRSIPVAGPRLFGVARFQGNEGWEELILVLTSVALDKPGG